MAGKLNLTLAREMLAFIARFFSMITTYPGTQVRMVQRMASWGGSAEFEECNLTLQGLHTTYGAHLHLVRSIT